MNIIKLIDKVTTKLGRRVIVELGVHNDFDGYLVDIRVVKDGRAYGNTLGITRRELALVNFKAYLDMRMDRKINEILELIKENP